MIAFTLAAVIAAAAMFGVTYGLSAPLIALDLHERGFGEVTIGLNAAMHAVGVLIVAPVLPRLAARFGQRPLTIAALLAAACLLTLFPLVALTLLWFPLRAALGAASELLFTLTESWSNELSPEAARGRIMATYTAALSLGFAAGPALLAWLGSGDAAYLAGAALALVAILPLLWPRLRVPEREEAAPVAPLRSLRLAPLAVAATLLNAAVETSGLSFITLYATRMGWSEAAGMHLITTLLVGAIVLQLPIGWLADRLPVRGLVLVLTVIAAIGAWAAPAMFALPWLAFSAVFVWGGVFVGIYTVMLVAVGNRFKGTELIAIYATMGLAWGVGALLGPSLAGFAMAWSPTEGFTTLIAMACAGFALLVLGSRSTV
ncbi:MAG: MFS transporter [Geminicoccaceae bacterium]